MKNHLRSRIGGNQMTEREERIVTRLNELSTLLGGEMTKWYTKNSVGEETTKYVITIKQ